MRMSTLYKKVNRFEELLEWPYSLRAWKRVLRYIYSKHLTGHPISCANLLTTSSPYHIWIGMQYRRMSQRPSPPKRKIQIVAFPKIDTNPNPWG